MKKQSDFARGFREGFHAGIVHACNILKAVTEWREEHDGKELPEEEFWQLVDAIPPVPEK